MLFTRSISKESSEAISSLFYKARNKKLDAFSEQVRFMANNKIEIKEDLETFSKNNYEEYRNLMGIRENLCKRYHRAKTKEKKV